MSSCFEGISTYISCISSQSQVPHEPPINPNQLYSEEFLKTYGFASIPVRGQKAMQATYTKRFYCLVAVVFIAIVLAVIPDTEVMLTIALTCITSSFRLICDSIIPCVLTMFKKGVTYESDLDWTNVLCTLFGGCVVCYLNLYRITDSGITINHTYQNLTGMIFGAMLFNLIMSNQSNTKDEERASGIVIAFQYFKRVRRILKEIKTNRHL